YLLILKYAISSPGNSSWNSLLSVVSIIFFLTNIFFYHYYSPTFSLDPELSGWFNRNLEKPLRLSKGTSKYNANVSLSWFKDSAKEHIKKIQELIEIAEKYDIIIERIASKNPGYIVFEDEYQVSAVPFKTDRKRVI
ncbi:MAG: hypothetical protein ACHQIM_01285, partial [Sphingobacteriales bacterium]